MLLFSSIIVFAAVVLATVVLAVAVAVFADFDAKIGIDENWNNGNYGPLRPTILPLIHSSLLGKNLYCCIVPRILFCAG